MMIPNIPDPTPGKATCGCLPPLTLLYNQSNQAWELASVVDLSVEDGLEEEYSGDECGGSYAGQQLEPIWEMTGGWVVC